ncbi:MAG: nicotinate (nicotinamide) nucleotide adenylyltransferase [Candidatus Krumholzibacteriota bacterium]|nr:nicotinate (nicotinamide) nucleotide adenylyltransferase [Candidatus Krumholzibacteriota bacterium]
MARRRRVGLLGGSFDPPHTGHLWMARRARDRLDLDEVWLLPAYQPPHKGADGLSPWRLRREMAALLAAEEPWLRVEPIEGERGGVSYTVDTVRDLQARHGEAIAFVLIIGEDSLRDVEGWKDPDALFAAVEVAVLARAGCAAATGRPCRLLAGETHPAQSRRIRAAVAAGEPPPWLTPEVAAYIERHGLYRRRAAGGRRP